MLGSKVLDCCRRESGCYKSNIHIAVLQGRSGFPKGKVLDLDVIVGDSGCFEDLTGVGFRPGASSPNSDAFALDISKCLDARLFVVTIWIVSG